MTEDFSRRFAAARRQIIEKEYANLNIDVEQILFDQYDSRDFEASADRLLAANADRS